MSYDYTRFADLKASIIAALALQQEDKAVEICDDSIYLNKSGGWFRKHLGRLIPINTQDDEFGTLIDLYHENHFSGNFAAMHDTLERHAKRILRDMEKAFTRWSIE